MRCVVLTLLVLAAPLAQATERDFLRVTCIPDARYFALEHKLIETSDEQAEPATPALRQAWRRNGLHEPDNLRVECHLPDSTYTATAKANRSRSGEVCDIELTLRWNDETWLDQVKIGPSCSDGGSLDSLEVYDGATVHRRPQAMKLCMSAGGMSPPHRHCEAFQPHPTQTSTRMLKQDDLEKYLAARAALKPGASAGGGFQRDARSLNQFLAVTTPCEFPGLALPPDAQVHVLINLPSRTLPFGIEPMRTRAYAADVHVNLPGRRVALVLIGGSGPTVYDLRWTRGTEIVAVASMGPRAAFAGLPKTVPAFSAHQGSGSACKYVSVSPGFPASEKAEVAAFVQQMYGRDPVSVTHHQYQQPAVLGEKAATSDYLQSREITVDSFAERRAELAGANGLERAVRDGLIRKADAQDASAWLAAWKAANAAKAARFKVSDAELLRYINLYDAYVVDKAFRYPPGMTQVAATFFVPKGRARPVGEPGHSIVYDFNNGSCSAAQRSLCQPFN